MGCASSTFTRCIKMRLEKQFARHVPNAHGDGISPDGFFIYGYASTQASRLIMEDYFDIRTNNQFDREPFGYFAVYDGHTGKRAAQYLRNNLFNNIVNHASFFSETRWVLVDAFDQTDDDLLECIGDHEDGSTASVVVLFEDRLVVAHVGDSRVVIARKNQNGIQLTTDHRPNVPAERQRIEDNGGYVLYNGSHRVLGRLAVSRAFGNKHLKLYVQAEPDINEEPVDETLECIIMASDGLWASLSNQEAVDIVLKENDVQGAASRLMNEALSGNDFDNITCIVVKLKHYN